MGKMAGTVCVHLVLAVIFLGPALFAQAADPSQADNGWLLLADIPPTSVTLGTRLFVAGGKPPEEKRTPLVTYFDMQTKKFGQVQILPAGRCCGSRGFIQGTLYLAGGFWEEVGDLVTCTVTWGRKIE
jgi:hypothetical protein